MRWRRVARLAFAVAVSACRPTPEAPRPSNRIPAAEARPAAEPEPEADPDEDPAPNAPGRESDVTDVTIKILADGRRKAHVLWGRKDLGVAPLAFKRPRGSGPMDLLIAADGCLPLHTRVFTDRDDTLAVRLYSEADAESLLGHPR